MDKRFQLNPSSALDVTTYLLHHVLARPKAYKRGWFDPETKQHFRSSAKERSGWLSYLYDREADVLYLSVGHPIAADVGDVTEDNLIVRYKNDEIIGITVLDASRWENRRDR